MGGTQTIEQLDTIVIGGGQAGLSAGYHLAERGLPFAILDADARIGDHWRERWDSLRLYSPARYDSLPACASPAPSSHWPTAREMADYLEAYARRFDLPVRSGTRVERIEPIDGGFVVSTADGGRLAARQVIVATGPFRSPASRPSPPSSTRRSGRCTRTTTATRHSSRGRGPRRRPVALGRRHRVRGRQRRPPDDPLGQVARSAADPGHRLAKRAMLGWPVVEFMFGHVLTLRTPMGRRMRPEIRKGGGPAHPGPPGRPRPGRRRAPRREDGRRARRPPGARRRHRARRCQRHLGDRLPPRLLVHRGAGRRRGRLAGRSRVVSARPCPACTSSAFRSSTPSRRCSWPVRAGTRPSSSSRSRSGCTLATAKRS